MKTFSIDITREALCQSSATITVRAASKARAIELTDERLHNNEYEVPWTRWSDWEPVENETIEVEYATEDNTISTPDLTDEEASTTLVVETFTTLNGSTVEAKVARAAFTKETLKEVCQ